MLLTVLLFPNEDLRGVFIWGVGARRTFFVVVVILVVSMSEPDCAFLPVCMCMCVCARVCVCVCISVFLCLPVVRTKMCMPFSAGCSDSVKYLKKSSKLSCCKVEETKSISSCFCLNWSGLNELLYGDVHVVGGETPTPRFVYQRLVVYPWFA